MFHFIQMFGFHDSWSHLYPAMISCWFYPLNIPQICLSSSFHYCHPSPTRLASTVCVDCRMSPLTDVPVPFLGTLSSVLPKTPERSVSKPKSIYSTLLLKALQWLSIAYKIIRLLTMTYGVLSGLPWPTLQPPPPHHQGCSSRRRPWFHLPPGLRICCSTCVPLACPPCRPQPECYFFFVWSRYLHQRPLWNQILFFPSVHLHDHWSKKSTSALTPLVHCYNPSAWPMVGAGWMSGEYTWIINHLIEAYSLKTQRFCRWDALKESG